MNDNLKVHSNRRVQYLVTISVSVATLTMGVTSAWPTPVIPKLGGNETDIEIDDDQIAWMVALSPPGFIVGSFASRFSSDRLGRRATVLASACPMTLGTIVLAFAMKAWLLYVARFLWGVGGGMMSTVIPIYIAEIADKEIRATLSLVTRVVFNLGNLLVMSVGIFVSFRCLNYTLLVLPATYLIACFWMPESPYFYLKEGRVDEATKALMKIRCLDAKEIKEELTRMQADVRSEMRRSSSAKELFCGKQYRKALLIAAGLRMTQTMSGTMTIQQYLGKINQDSKSNLDLTTVVIVFGIVRFVVGIMSSIIADRVGRRPLLFYSLLGTGFSLTLVCIYFLLQEVIEVDQETLSRYGFVPFAGIILSVIISTLGYNSVIAVIPPEIFPLNVKAVGMTSLSVFGGVSGFIVAKGFQVVKNQAGLSGVFCVFAGFCIAGAVFAISFVPETKGKSLKEIQILLQGDIYNEAEGERLDQLNGGKNTENGECRELKEICHKENDVKL